MLKNFDIVTFGPSDFWANNPSCCTHIMQKLSAGNRIIYVNPISSDLLAVRSRKGIFVRVVRKLKSILKFVRKVDKGFYVLSPVFVPIQGNVFFDKVNNFLLKSQLGTLMLFVGIKRPLLWIENVRAADFITSFKWKLVVYHVSDRFEECPYTNNKEKLRQREALVTGSSDVIICVSDELYQSKSNAKAQVHYLAHGVDFERFRNAAESNEVSEDIFNVAHPIAGYFGTLTAENDIEMLEYCAEKNQDVSFVLAGRITAGDYSKLQQMPNVFFTGQVPYERVPAMCANFDVCLMPWKMNKWIVNCNPLKLKEYMASGRPIVSVKINEVNKYSELISIAETKEQFSRAVKWELANDSAERRKKRIEIAKQHSWNGHVERLCEIIYP